MKKGLLILATVAFVATFSSCKKKYQCECTWNSGSLKGQTTTLETEEKVSKKDAEDWCAENEEAISYADGTCELK